MRIGIDARCIRKPDLRGIGRYLANTIRYCAEREPAWQFLLFHDARAGQHDHFPDISNVRWVPLAMKGDRLFLWEQARFPWAARGADVGVLHSPANTAPLWQPRPAVLTLHDTLLMDFDEDETRGFLFYTRKIIPRALRTVKRIVTVSESSKRDIISRFRIPEDRVVVIYHGRDPDFRPAQEPESVRVVLRRMGVKEKYVLCLGARGPRKNTARVIEAFRLLRERFPDVTLAVCGVQEDAQAGLQRVIRDAGLENGVVVTGFVGREELVALYSGARLLLYPSLYEGFGFPILEAMACGCPVVTSNVSSMPEIAGGAGVLVNPETVTDIADKTARVLADERLRKEMREKGLKRAEAFDWRRSAEKMVEVYREAAEGRDSAA